MYNAIFTNKYWSSCLDLYIDHSCNCGSDGVNMNYIIDFIGEVNYGPYMADNASEKINIRYFKTIFEHALVSFASRDYMYDGWSSYDSFRKWAAVEFDEDNIFNVVVYISQFIMAVGNVFSGADSRDDNKTYTSLRRINKYENFLRLYDINTLRSAYKKFPYFPVFPLTPLDTYSGQQLDQFEPADGELGRFIVDR
jgi:hypothetical protein